VNDRERSSFPHKEVLSNGGHEVDKDHVVCACLLIVKENDTHCLLTIVPDRISEIDCTFWVLNVGLKRAISVSQDAKAVVLGADIASLNLVVGISSSESATLFEDCFKWSNNVEGIEAKRPVDVAIVESAFICIWLDNAVVLSITHNCWSC